jgi:hypothetical protein
VLAVNAVGREWRWAVVLGRRFHPAGMAIFLLQIPVVSPRSTTGYLL